MACVNTCFNIQLTSIVVGEPSNGSKGPGFTRIGIRFEHVYMGVIPLLVSM